MRAAGHSSGHVATCIQHAVLEVATSLVHLHQRAPWPLDASHGRHAIEEYWSQLGELAGAPSQASLPFEPANFVWYIDTLLSSCTHTPPPPLLSVGRPTFNFTRLAAPFTAGMATLRRTSVTRTAMATTDDDTREVDLEAGEDEPLYEPTVPQVPA